jgi:hypothetical protein
LRDAALDTQTLVLAQQERGRRQPHPVRGDGLQPGIGRARPGEQRDVRGLGVPPQTHHPRHVRAVQVGVDQPGPLPLGGERQG